MPVFFVISEQYLILFADDIFLFFGRTILFFDGFFAKSIHISTLIFKSY